MEEPNRFIEIFICFFTVVMAWGLLCFFVAGVVFNRRHNRLVQEHFARLHAEGKSTVHPKPRLRSGVDSRKRKRALGGSLESEWPSYGPFVMGRGELSSLASLDLKGGSQ